MLKGRYMTCESIRNESNLCHDNDDDDGSLVFWLDNFGVFNVC